MGNEQGILLKTGTNEVELMEFKVGQYSQCVNVLKIVRILQYSSHVPDPMLNMHPSVVGMIKNEGITIPIIDMAELYGEKKDRLFDLHRQAIILSEFNEKRIGFLVDAVIAFRRMAWSDLQTIDDTSLRYVTALAPVEDRFLDMVDFESIITDVLREKEDHIEAVDMEYAEKRATISVAVADDSQTIRKKLKQILEASGYKNLTIFTNGQDLYEDVIDRSQENSNRPMFDIVISDIEMPKMDGLTLCKRLKENFEVKIILVSSLVSDKLQKKCELVQANGSVPKNRIYSIVKEMDNLLFND